MPKSYLPEYREYYEKRQFRAARDAVGDELRLLGRRRPVRPRPAVRRAATCPASRCTSRSARTCGRRSRRAPTARWPAPPCWRTCRRATSRSARPTTAARCAPSQSARTIAGYVYTAAGLGESTTDLAWDGQALIYENGDLLAESGALRRRRAADRRRPRPRPDRRRPRRARAATATRSTTTATRLARMRRIEFELGVAGRHGSAAPRGRALPLRPGRPGQPQRALRGGLQHPGPRARDAAARHRDREDRDRRLRRAGLDARADRRRARDRPARACPRENVLAYTMPGFATSALTLRQRPRADAGARRQRRTRSTSAPRRRRCSATSATRPPTASRVYDVTYENVQAGERTSHLFRLANHHGALVLGTGDLSELALGWSHLRRRRPDVALQRQRLGAQDADPVPHPLGDRHRPVRRRRRAQVLDVGARAPRSRRSSSPADDPDPTSPAPTARASSAPTSCQDFFLYYTLRFGYRPSKVAFLAHHAWGDRDAGAGRT